MRASPSTDGDLVGIAPRAEAKEGGRAGGRDGQGKGEAVEEGRKMQEDFTSVHEEGRRVVPFVA
jgi:hypothetical protein